MADFAARVSHLEGVLAQMHERLGNIEATLRDLAAGQRELTIGMNAALRQLEGRMATRGELRVYAGLVSAWIGVVMGILLRFG